MKLTKKEQLGKAFEILVETFIQYNIDMENCYNTKDMDIDHLVHRLVKEVTIRTNLK